MSLLDPPSAKEEGRTVAAAAIQRAIRPYDRELGTFEHCGVAWHACDGAIVTDDASIGEHDHEALEVDVPGALKQCANAAITPARLWRRTPI